MMILISIIFFVITRIQKDQGTSPSGTAYFALIMTSLEKILTSGASPSDRHSDEDNMDDDEDSGGEDENTLSSTIMLLYYVLPRFVPCPLHLS